MKAEKLLHLKRMHGLGIVEILVWRVPAPIPPAAHRFKYRLAFVVNGERVVGYDNERGKGDHKHVGGREAKYRFVDPASLVDDFWKDVEAYCDG